MSFSANVHSLVEQSSAPLVQKAARWVRSPLGEVAAILNGFPFKSDFFNGSRGDPVIRIRDVTSGRTDTRYSGPPMEGFWVEAGDLIVGMDGDFNSRVWSGPRALLNQRVCKITPDERILNRSFLAYLLPGYLRLINEETHSVTVKHLSSRTLQELPLPLPPLAEQRRIVSKLDALTARTSRARADLDRNPTLAQRYREAVLSQYFDTELGSPSLRLEEITPTDAKIIYGILQPGPDTPGGVPYVRPTEIVDGRLELDAMRRTTSEIAQRYKRSTLAEGDVLLSIVGTIGKVAVVPPDLTGANITQSSCRIRPRADVLTSAYLRYFLLSPMAKKQYNDARLGTAVPRLNLEDVRDIKIPLPAVTKQVEIVRRIDAAFAEIDQLTAETAAARRLLDRLDQAILAKALRGDLVPQDPADQPASVLLDRIRAERATTPKAKRGRPSRLGNNEVEAA